VISKYIIKYINYIEYFEININIILFQYLIFIIYIKDRELNIYSIKYLKIIIFLSRESYLYIEYLYYYNFLTRG